MPSLDDQRNLAVLLRDFVAGEPKLHATIRARLSRYVAVKATVCASEREDLVGDILMALLSGLKNRRFRGKSLPEFNAYLYGIARLKIIQLAEKNQRTPFVDQSASRDSLPDTRVTSDHGAANRELAAKVYAALESRCRELLMLRFEEGWTDQEIADFKEMSKNAVSTAISRCLERARNLGFVRESLYQKPSEDDLRGNG